MDAILTGVGIGIATSACWAVVVLLYNKWRDTNLETKFRKCLAPVGIGVGVGNVVSIKVTNDEMMPVVIRDVVLVGNEERATWSLELLPDGSSRGLEADRFGWTELPPKTFGKWAVLPPASVQGEVINNFLPLQFVKLVVQYETLFGTTRIIDIHPEPQHNSYIVDTFEKALKGELPSRS